MSNKQQQAERQAMKLQRWKPDLDHNFYFDGMVETDGSGYAEDAEVTALEARCAELEAYIEKASTLKDAAYSERNGLVAVLSKVFPAHIAKAREATDPDWAWIVFVNTPEGQCSWHIHESERARFGHLETRPNEWDGHNSEEKWVRLESLMDGCAVPAAERDEQAKIALRESTRANKLKADNAALKDVVRAALELNPKGATVKGPWSNLCQAVDNFKARESAESGAQDD